MPYRKEGRDQDWLLPPSLGELIRADDMVRFVAEYVDNLNLAEYGIRCEPAAEGAPAYSPRLLIAVWAVRVHAPSAHHAEDRGGLPGEGAVHVADGQCNDRTT